MEIGSIYDEITQNGEFHTIFQIIDDSDDGYVLARRLCMWDDTGNYFYITPHRDGVVMSAIDLQKVNKSKLFWALFHKIIDKPQR